MLLYITFSNDHCKKCNCCDVYKISLWSVQHILNQGPPNFGRISNSIAIPLMERAPVSTSLSVKVSEIFPNMKLLLHISLGTFQKYQITQFTGIPRDHRALCVCLNPSRAVKHHMDTVVWAIGIHTFFPLMHESPIVFKHYINIKFPSTCTATI